MAERDLSNPDFHLALQFVSHTGQHIFLTGKAGTGKTTFLKYISEHVTKKMAVVAPTGVAAINAGGVTMHSFFQLPFTPFIPGKENSWFRQDAVSNEQTLIKSIRFSAAKKELLQELDLLVIDEVSMLRADTLDAMDAVLRFSRDRSEPFGGLQILFIGDMHQLPPVINKTEWELLKPYYVSPFFFHALVLKQCPLVKISLKKIYRQKDSVFIDLLNNIRNNQVSEQDLETLHQHLDPEFQPSRGEQYITLTTHNNRADTINKNQLEKLGGEIYSFDAQLTGDFDPRSVTAETNLFLRKGAQVMFVKNDKGENRRFFNGKIGTVTNISYEEIKVKFPGEPFELIVEKETWKNIRYHYNREQATVEEETIGSFTQYPVRLAWAITIHKSQGLTFEKAIIDAGASFAPGQVYVALSRLTSLAGLIMYSRIHPGSIVVDPAVAAFTASEEAHEDLQSRLQEEKSVFLLRMIEEAFQWDKLLTVFRNHHHAYGSQMLQVKDKASDWALRSLENAEQEKMVSEKFGRQLAGLLATGREDGYELLQTRIKAAGKYFISVLDGLIYSASKRKTEARMTSKHKKYVKELGGIEKTLLFKKEELNRALNMGEGLRKGMDTDVLLKLTDPDRKTKEEKPTRVTAAKLGKGESQRVSLQLFKEKKSIPEIAAIRGFAITTIENHLVSFIPAGEIEVHELVMAEKIKPIIAAIREAGDSRLLSPIKEKLGSSFSYLDIKAVIRHCEEKTGDLPGKV